MSGLANAEHLINKGLSRFLNVAINEALADIRKDDTVTLKDAIAIGAVGRGRNMAHILLFASLQQISKRTGNCLSAR